MFEILIICLANESQLDISKTLWPSRKLRPLFSKQIQIHIWKSSRNACNHQNIFNMKTHYSLGENSFIITYGPALKIRKCWHSILLFICHVFSFDGRSDTLFCSFYHNFSAWDLCLLLSQFLFTTKYVAKLHSILSAISKSSARNLQHHKWIQIGPDGKSKSIVEFVTAQNKI